MKKTIAISAILLLFILLILVPSLVVTSRPSESYSNPNAFFNSLISPKSYNFSFTSKNANINSLTFALKNPQILNNSLIDFIISNGTDDRKLSFSGANIGDPSNLVLKFAPLNSTISPYIVSITTDNVTPESLFILTDLNSKPIFSSTYYQSGLSNRLKYNFQKLSNQISHINPIYTFFYAIILLLTFLLL